jgi:opacity protein-like surface antigen
MFSKKVIYGLVLTLLPVKAKALLPFGIYFGPKVGISLNRTSEQKQDPAIDMITDLAKNSDYNTALKLATAKNSFSGGAVAGVRFLGFRIDGEYNFRSKIAEPVIKIEGIDAVKAYTINGHNILLNGYYNLLDLNFVKIYGGVSVGQTIFVKNLKEKINTANTWGGGGGVTFSLLNLLNVDVGYRYLDMGKMQLDNVESKQFSHDISLGIRLGF